MADHPSTVPRSFVSARSSIHPCSASVPISGISTAEILAHIQFFTEETWELLPQAPYGDSLYDMVTMIQQ